MKLYKFVIIALASFALTACDGELGSAFGGGANKTEEELQLERSAKSLSEQSNDIIVKNAISGALAGAALGCGFQLLQGGSAEECAQGAVVGGALGGAGGAAIGQAAANKNEEIIKRGEAISELLKVNKELVVVQSQLKSVISKQNAEIRQLRADLNAGTVSEKDYNARLKAINSNRSYVKAQIEKANDNVEDAASEIQQAQNQGQTGLTKLADAAEWSSQKLEATMNQIQLIN